jgi:peptidylamidoglycolate lyase
LQYTFNKPADVSVDPVSGTVFVADGYGNSRVVAFTPEGVFLRMFGVSIIAIPFAVSF